LLDQALLRPGRLEVHVEIGLPDEKGRLQIFHIHTLKMKENGKLSKDVDFPKLALLSKNFSGAEIEGLVKSAVSHALSGSIDVVGGAVTRKEEVDKLMVKMEHFLLALDEVHPAFGVQEDELKPLIRGELFDYGEAYTKIIKTAETLVQQVRDSDNTYVLSILLEGRPGSGKTAIAAKIGMGSEFPFVKLISPEQYLGTSEMFKCNEIAKVFEDAYKSPLSLIILDNIERLLEYVPIGPRFSNSILQTLMVLIKRVPSRERRRLLIVATTSSPTVLRDLAMKECFNVILPVQELVTTNQIINVIRSMKLELEDEESELESIVLPFLPLPMKKLLLVIDMAKQGNKPITATKFMQCLEDAGLKKEDDFK